MKVETFEIERGVTGVIVRVEVSTEVEVKLGFLEPQGVVKGFNYDDERKLRGEESFVMLRFETIVLETLRQAERAVCVIKAILEEVRRREQAEMSKLQEVEDYLRKEFAELITDQGGKNGSCNNNQKQ